MDPKQRRRNTRERELARKIKALPRRRFGLLYVDPPWRFQPYSRITGMDRAADNHYPTMTTKEIAALKVPAAPDCVLYLWATAPMLRDALDVMSAWGFTYKSHMVWIKNHQGTGYWFRNQHELLLIGTRGRVPAPAPGTQWSSALHAPRSAHSVKPSAVRRMLERQFPTTPKLEMFARGGRIRGWTRWGAEVEDE